MKTTYSFEQKAASFWSRVDRSGGPDACWTWQGAVTSQHRYGCFQTSGGQVLGAHKVSWLLSNGSAQGLCVLHKCDNRVCVNPAHLYLGTKKDNSWDKIIRNRDPNRSFKPDEVRAIRAELATGKWGIIRQLAKRYGVSTSCISAIRSRRNYVYVE